MLLPARARGLFTSPRSVCPCSSSMPYNTAGRHARARRTRNDRGQRLSRLLGRRGHTRDGIRIAGGCWMRILCAAWGGEVLFLGCHWGVLGMMIEFRLRSEHWQSCAEHDARVKRLLFQVKPCVINYGLK